MLEKLKENKIKIIVLLVIWILLVVLFISVIAVSLKNSILGMGIDSVKFIEEFSSNIKSPLSSFGTVLYKTGYFSIYSPLVAIFSVVYLASIIIYILKRDSDDDDEYKDIEHGSSGWCKKGEQYSILDPKEGILLAEKNYLPLTKRGNLNVLIVGGSGSGKSASYVVPNAYQMLGSYIFTDPKGELYDKTAGYLKENGYDIKVLNLVSPKNSDGYNPLMHISSEIDVDVIAKTVVKGQKQENAGSDPYWDNMSELLLKSLIYYLISTRPDEERNLASCAELIRAASNNSGENLLSNLINVLPVEHPARRNYKNVELASDKTYQSILSSLQSMLGKFDSREIAELTSTDTIDFEAIGKKKTAVYVISSDTHTAYDFLLTIFFSQMIQQLYDFADKNGGRLEVPVYFILDEFANIGRIPDFDKKISTSRSRGINFSVILQNLDQLEAVYKESYETIIGNCDTHVFLGSNSQKTVEYFSKALGEKTIKRESKSVSKGKDSSEQVSESDQILARALMTPDELRRMDNDDCIIYEKGIKPVKARKYYYFEYETANYEKRFPSNHNDAGPGTRGEWRTYNPYNPYIEEKVPDMNENIQTLDDLFEEEEVIKPIEETNIQNELEEKFDELFGDLDTLINK